MANMFALILAIATMLTGIIWCLERFKWAPMRQAKIAAISSPTAGVVAVDSDIAQPPGWIETCSSVFPVLALVFVVRSFIYEPFQIPSGSMMPTFLIGDFILVEKFAYGIKDPIMQTTLIPTSHPKRGDAVVFKYPLNPRVDYIKRVVGLPGDRVIYDSITKEVTVQSSCSSDEFCTSALATTYSATRPSDFVQTFQRSGNEVASGGFFQIKEGQPVPRGGRRLSERIEKQDSASHAILTLPDAQDQLAMYYQQPGQPLGVWVVPEGHYFMMGDNRDNSADSRFWGFVPEKNLVGKATAIWMSFEKQEGEWPTGLRLSRIGGIH